MEAGGGKTKETGNILTNGNIIKMDGEGNKRKDLAGKAAEAEKKPDKDEKA